MKKKIKWQFIERTAIAAFLAVMIFALINCKEPESDRVINIAVIQGVTPPITGETPVTEIKPTAQYTGTVIWSPVHPVFQNSTVYFATIKITPKKGYTPQGVTTDFFKVPGASKVSNDEDSGVIIAVFPRTAGTLDNPAVIDIKTIEGITPKSGETPKTAINPTAQYTGTVTWSPDDNTFKADTLYTATVSLTPKAGFTMKGVMADFFTVTGAYKVNNDANTDIVTAVFYTGIFVPVTSVTLNQNTLTLTVGDTETLTVVIEPANAIIKNVTWVSSNTSVATVTNGTITAVAVGSTTITITTQDGEKTADCAVIVKATGAAVTKPTVSDLPTSNSITVNAVTLVTDTRQSIEYAINTVNNDCPSTWQSDTTFTGLNSATTYYVYARSMSNTNYNAGSASVSAEIITATPVTLNSIIADGSSTQTTTKLTLTFDKAISGLSASDIILSGVSGVSKGTLSGSNPYTLPVSGFSSCGTLNVVVAKSGYILSGSPKMVDIYYCIPVTLNSITTDSSSTQTTIQLTLTFDNAIDGLSASNITLSGVSGVSKGTLSGSNPYTLPISGDTSGTLSVAVSKSGYAIYGSPKTVLINEMVEMIQIPGGSFEMGSNNGEIKEQPVHTVTLSGFYMGKYEVTQEQWMAVMGNNPSDFTSSPASGEVQSKRPVDLVRWYDTLVFCNRLSVLEGLSPAYRISGSTDPANWGTVPTNSNSAWNAVQIVAGSTGYRLPTEAQWEYAARGGNGSPGNYTYSGSNTVSDVAWYKSNSDDKTHEVGKKAPNDLGLYDMSGNVWEWCWDQYSDSYYSSSPANDPMGPSYGTNRVLRGGSWTNFEGNFRSTYRAVIGPYDRYSHFGLRLVRP